MKKIISMLFIITGLIIIISPKISEYYHIYQQNQFIEEWQESLSIINDDKQSLQNHTNAEALNENDPLTSTSSLNLIESNTTNSEELLEAQRISKEKEETKKKQRAAYIKEHMEGMLKIEKIDLYLPILKNATIKNLKVSVASINNTGKIGKIGNYCIAGHRSHTYGQKFNRLDELVIGDNIEVINTTTNYNYIVYDKFLVQQDDTWVLTKNNTAKEITLITCHPMLNPTHRLIIKGKIIE
ncbi:class D sortase [Crassaminicella profunda]|uniref:class D sortase n=1 Tax=Crassaminicella profunda TaxID=1286698 RepID=UPI001CA74C2F|nr:class D sortase [Crassaminicella profunda]QZY54198.1 class D sortase [Crassaminicella profunda]